MADLSASAVRAYPDLDVQPVDVIRIDSVRASLAQVVSEMAASHALLNCLIKEFALPENRARYAWPSHVRGIAPASYLRAIQGKGMPLVIDLPQKWQFLVLVDRRDPLGSQRYLSDVYTRQGDADWRCPPFAEFAAQLLEACQQLTGSCNEELLEQVMQSQGVTAAIVDSALESEESDPLRDYLASEQGLWFGHPNHPAPKARLWPEHLGQKTYAPEFRARVLLHVLEVPRDGLQLRGNDLSDEQVLEGFVNQRLVRSGRAAICLHPVQAQLFLADPRVKGLIERGEIVDLGQKGPLASPTASMRTWYGEGRGYFLKGSLNVRITNCVRKNAWYELDSAMLIDRLFTRLQREHKATIGGATLVSEPGSLSWAPAGSSAEDSHWFREQTGAILRENFCRYVPAESCLMAGTLFARDLQLQPLIHGFLQQASDEHLLGWLDAYQALLLRPVLSLFFNHGVVLEPHLQNAVLVHDNGWPAQLLLRDFEGVKLTDDLGVSYLEGGVQERVRQSLTYSRQQGWKRISYCLFVNNLSEAILALSWERPHLAAIMWRRVERQLRELRGELVRPAPELDALLAGEPIACKTNLKVRLSAQADRHAGYVQLACPWAEGGSMDKLPTAVLDAIEQARSRAADPLAVFVYDLDALVQHVREVMAELPPGVELYYAIKANSEAPILQTLLPLVDGFEISSGGEIERLQAAASDKPFVFSGPGKLDSDLRAALSHGVEAIHIESLGEIDRLQRIAAELGRVQAVFIRINPELPATLSSRLAMAGTATPFGLDESEVAQAVRRVEACNHLRLKGFHVHAMSHQQQVERHEQLLDLYLERWSQWKALATRPETVTHLNVGGGIGVDYLSGERFDWSRLCRHLEQRLGAQQDAPVVRFEPGRFISAFCGYYAIEVLDAKSSHGQHFLVCRGGTHQFRLPVAQGHDHPVIHVPAPGRAASGVPRLWTVVGQLCTPKDVLSRGRQLVDATVGDLLVLPLAGAYGYNISHADFLCHPRPEQLFVRGEGSRGGDG